MENKQVNNLLTLLEQCADSKEDIEQIKDMRQTVEIEQAEKQQKNLKNKTEEQYIMKYTTIEQVRDKLHEVSNFARDNELNFALLFKADPITGGAEHRLIFSDSNTECRIWLDENIEKLNNMKIPYSAHLTNEFYGSCGDIFAISPISQ